MNLLSPLSFGQTQLNFSMLTSQNPNSPKLFQLITTTEADKKDGVISQFASKMPREQGGPRSANRTDYQLSWAFCLLLDLEKQSENYLMVLDYHDDVVVFDSENDATSVSFYQVKTSSSQKWTLARLIERSEGKLSILGKLYAHKVDFAGEVCTLNFVSDQVFSLQLGNENKPKDLDESQFSALCAAAIDKVKNSLKDEHKLDRDIEADVEFIFKRDAMSSKGHRHYAEGKFSEFLSSKFGDKPYMVSHAFRSLIDLLRQRNNFEGDVSSEEKLRKLKSIGKSELSPLLLRSARAGDSAAWDRLERMLLTCNLGIGAIRRHQALWQSREIELLDYSNIVIQEAQIACDQIVAQLIQQDESANAVTIINRATAILRERSSQSPIPFSENQTNGAILSSLTKSFQ